MRSFKILILSVVIFTVFLLEATTSHFAIQWANEFKTAVELKARRQADRNLDLIELFISKDLEAKEVVTSKDIYEAIHKVGSSKICGPTGDIFAIELVKGVLFYDNSADCSTGELQRFSQEDLFWYADANGGDSTTMAKAWSEHLRHRADNSPDDRVSWNFDGNEEWLVCRVLPTEVDGFNGIPSATGKAFQIKVCQGIQADEAFNGLNVTLTSFESYKGVLLSIVRVIVFLTLVIVLLSYLLDRPKKRR